jgi:hypothetical protein
MRPKVIVNTPTYIFNPGNGSRHVHCPAGNLACDVLNTFPRYSAQSPLIFAFPLHTHSWGTERERARARESHIYSLHVWFNAHIPSEGEREAARERERERERYIFCVFDLMHAYIRVTRTLIANLPSLTLSLARSRSPSLARARSGSLTLALSGPLFVLSPPPPPLSTHSNSYGVRILHVFHHHYLLWNSHRRLAACCFVLSVGDCDCPVTHTRKECQSNIKVFTKMRAWLCRKWWVNLRLGRLL